MAEHWIVPSNSSTFDTAAAFEHQREVNWSEVGESSIEAGDTVYLYSSRPSSSVSHKCLVTATRVRQEDLVDDAAFWRDPMALAERLERRSWMKLELVLTFDTSDRRKLSLTELQSHGLKGTMSGRQRLTESVLAYIQSMETPSVDRVSQFWWVNQGVTGVTVSHSGDFTNLWAALKDAQGNTQPSWDALDQAEPGDLVLHYANGFVIGSSRVATLSRPAIRPLAFETEVRSGGDGRELLLEGFELFDVPIALDEIPIELRRSERGSGAPFTTEGRVQRGYLFPIDSSVAKAVFTSAGLAVDSREPNETTGGDSALERCLAIDETDGVATVRYRKEQSALRKRLFGSADSARCAICGRRYPVAYLHAAHVKSRSACTEAERKDWKNVVIPACLFGCDALFEMGMIEVDRNGVVSLREGHDMTPAFAAFTKSLVGKTVRGFTAENRKYFEWRNAQSSSGRS
jgi:hypothetical protein